MNKIVLGISSCLLGNKVRYDGNHQLDRYITGTLGRFFELMPVCPEAEAGMGIPREPMRLVEQAAGVRLVTITSGIDRTDQMSTWIDRKLAEIQDNGMSGFIFKARSPSCAIADAPMYSVKGSLKRKGPGLFAADFIKRFPLMPVIDEGSLHDPVLRENFIERVSVFARWQDFVRSVPGAAGFVNFHAGHKLLIMSHSPQAVAALGRIVARCKRRPARDMLDEYSSLQMKTLLLIATTGKHTNVLHHCAGYFKKELTPDQKRELQEVIASYHSGQVPLIVPITLITHYARMSGQSYLLSQAYLNPYPLELMARNHV